MRTQLALSARAGSIDEARAAVRAADEAVVEAERMLGQLLLMSRVDSVASQAAAAREAVDLAALAQAVVADAILRAAEAGVDLGFDQDGPAVVQAEPLLLREMLRNLVDNSIAYAGQGAEATVRVGGGDAPWLEVTDTGAGVSPGLLAGLGSRFSRGDAGKPGAGLGLSIVREIASLFGAAVTISAPEGQGFSVRVAFPQRVDAAPGERVSA